VDPSKPPADALNGIANALKVTTAQEELTREKIRYTQEQTLTSKRARETATVETIEIAKY
jgi:hypothetical protein